MAAYLQTGAEEKKATTAVGDIRYDVALSVGHDAAIPGGAAQRTRKERSTV